jgi:hypothetical protein
MPALIFAASKPGGRAGSEKSTVSGFWPTNNIRVKCFLHPFGFGHAADSINAALHALRFILSRSSNSTDALPSSVQSCSPIRNRRIPYSDHEKSNDSYGDWRSCRTHIRPASYFAEVARARERLRNQHRKPSSRNARPDVSDGSNSDLGPCLG